ncbi:hypothetical protein Acr_06g0014890 [Actinidia rufa]|uniref:MATH domain-containing protein n=1 Tax=Actinidia rufa TaxID=165716 RepID=A0A7J0EUB1_9ERIC|nr:hypothetical protein Acr_06g0014890 [Actinidia rufa]
MKSEWGFGKFLPLNTFNDASNGHMVDDCCIFGAEVLVIKQTGKGQSFSMIKNPVNNKYIWKIKKEEEICSDEFVVGDHKWKLLFFPDGIGNLKGERVSLFLEFNDMEILFPEQRLYAEFKLRIRHQLFSGTGIHVEKEGNAWFSTSSPEWGFGDFFSRSDLNNASKGYIVNDTVIVEAEITLISSFKDF